ncbi:hypothetical protein [uncultured Hymenobacter sp.]|uniref:hypothetical protein n=1 Tax=uncultured Hymenobacter sp. TaxID=170016 RepID=UPI0035CC0D73
MREKRVRGLRRHWRDHQRQAAIPEMLSRSMIEQHQYDREKLGLSPWNVYDKPPLAFRKLWVSRLLADFQQWHKELASFHSEFYLAVWLFEPRFGQSQLVAGISERKTRYEGIFSEAENTPLPVEYQELPGVAALRWVRHAEVEAFWADEFAERGTWASSKPHWEFKTLDGETCIAVQVGWVWVGQAPE